MNVSVASLVAVMGSIARSIAPWLIAAWLLLTAAGSAIDVVAAEGSVSSPGNFAITIVQLALTVAVMRRGLDASGIERRGGAGIGGLFLISIPLNLGVGLGLLLLVVPGLYLSARWRLAVPHLFATDEGIGGAMGFSWRQTGTCWAPLMLATALTVVPMLIGVAIFALTIEGSMPLAASVAANAAIYAGILLGWLLDLAAYRLIAHPASELVETFA